MRTVISCDEKHVQILMPHAEFKPTILLLARFETVCLEICQHVHMFFLTLKIQFVFPKI
jgi:hypothetical protein